jgi:hypothetical protein
MGLMALLKIVTKLVKAQDMIAFLVSAFITYLVSAVLPQGPWTIYVFILLFYHMFLAWLVFDPEREKIYSVPILPAILMHVTAVALIVGFLMARNSIPFFIVLRFGVASLAAVERKMISSWGVKRTEAPVSAKAAAVSAAAAVEIDSLTGEEYEEWLTYLRKRDPKSVKAGTTVKDEFQQWLLARAQARAAISSNANPVSTALSQSNPPAV